MANEIGILVALVDEATDVYVSASCEQIASNLYRLTAISEVYDAESEFKPGDEIRLIEKMISGEIQLVATK